MSSDTPPPTSSPSDDDSVAEAAIEALDSAVDQSLQNVDATARYQSRIAIITAIVALVSAILGPVVSLAINKGQIDSQRAQDKSQREEATAEFIRGQRQTAYGDYLAAYNNSALDFLNDAGKFSTGGYPVSAITKDLTALVTALKEVSADFYTITLVGSKKTVAQAIKTYNAYGDAANVIIDFGGRRTRGESISAADVTAFQDKTQSDYQGLVQIAQEFVGEARKDLDAS